MSSNNNLNPVHRATSGRIFWIYQIVVLAVCLALLSIFFGTKQMESFDCERTNNNHIDEPHIRQRQMATREETTKKNSSNSIGGSVVRTADDVVVSPPQQLLDEYQVPPCDQLTNYSYWVECIPKNATIDVILIVYRRKSLALQLDMIAKQTFPVSNVWVVQNGDELDAPPIIEEFKKHQQTTSNFQIHHIHYHTNSRFFGRFHVAYQMSNAKYVSLWDDDMDIGPGYLEYVLKYLESREGDAVVGSAGHVLASVVDDGFYFHHLTKHGTTSAIPEGSPPTRVDYPIQSYHLRRELIRHLLAAPVYTYATGEDLQLAFALQKQGIFSYILPSNGTTTYARHSEKMGSASTKLGAASRQRQEPRNWLRCKLALEGMDYHRCRNCKDVATMKKCTDLFENGGRW